MKMVNKRSCLMILILISLILIIISAIPSYSLAFDPIGDPGSIRPGDMQDSDVTIFTEKAKPIINAISIFGIIVAVITLTILGIKYMIGSVEEKAEYKKTMSSYIIGVIFLVGIVTILQLINNLVVPLMDTI